MTTIAPLSRTSRCGLWKTRFAEPPKNAPVCSHTMTGAGTVGKGSLTQTFSLRQSSLPVRTRSGSRIEGQLDCVLFAFRNVQAGAGCGGFHRSSPSGGAAYGIPAKTHESPLSAPCTGPFSVDTRHEALCVCMVRGTVTDPTHVITKTAVRTARCMLDRKSTRLNSSHSQISYA